MMGSQILQAHVGFLGSCLDKTLMRERLSAPFYLNTMHSLVGLIELWRAGAHPKNSAQPHRTVWSNRHIEGQLPPGASTIRREAGRSLRRRVGLRWAHRAQAAFSISNCEVTTRTPPWMSVAQAGSYGHIRRLQGRITILYVDSR